MNHEAFVRDRAFSFLGRVPKCCRTRGGVGEISWLAIIGRARLIGSCKGLSTDFSSSREQPGATHSRRRTCSAPTKKIPEPSAGLGSIKTTGSAIFHLRPVSGAAMVPAFLVTKLQKLLGSWQTQTHRPTSIRPRCAGLLVL